MLRLVYCQTRMAVCYTLINVLLINKQFRLFAVPWCVLGTSAIPNKKSLIFLHVKVIFTSLFFSFNSRVKIQSTKAPSPLWSIPNMKENNCATLNSAVTPINLVSRVVTAPAISPTHIRVHVLFRCTVHLYVLFIPRRKAGKEEFVLTKQCACKMFVKVFLTFCLHLKPLSFPCLLSPLHVRRLPDSLSFSGRDSWCLCVQERMLKRVVVEAAMSVNVAQSWCF